MRISPDHTFFIENIRVERHNLRCGNGTAWVNVEPKVMAFLCQLAAQPFTLLRRSQLMDAIWPEESVSDESLTRLAYQARRALLRLGGDAAQIRTVSRKGYMLDAAVSRLARAAGSQRAQRLLDDLGLPKIAVVRFIDPAARKDDRYLVDGLTRDLTALLSRVPDFMVVPYSSAMRVDPEAMHAGEMSDFLGARFLVSGSLHREKDQLRVRVALTDVVAGQLIWAERYDVGLDRFFEIQDEAVVTITSTIAAGLKWETPTFAPAPRIFSDPVYRRLQKSEQLRANYSRANAEKITRLLGEARALAPDQAAPPALLAVQISQNLVSGWTTDPAQDRATALSLIDEALLLDPTNSDILSAAGIVSAMLHLPDDAIRYLTQAHRSNPSDAHAMAVLGWQMCLRQNNRSGIELLERAEQRAPHHPRFGLWATYRGTAFLFMLDYEAGLDVCETAIHRTPNYYQPLLTTAWAHVGLGQHEKARKLVAKAQAMESKAVVEKFVAEMKRWAINSPNHADCFVVLDELALLA